MGAISKCCCTEEFPDCVCDEIWEVATWDFNVFGVDFSGTLAPEEKPVVSNVENSCDRRIGIYCDYDEPFIILDTLYNYGSIEQSLSSVNLLCSCQSCSGPITVANWRNKEYLAKREVLWHHVQRNGQITIEECNTGGGITPLEKKFKVRVEIVFSATRIQRAYTKRVVAQQLWKRDCPSGEPYSEGSYLFGCGQSESSYLDIPQPELPEIWPQLDLQVPCPTSTHIQTHTFADEDINRTRVAPLCLTFGGECETQNIVNAYDCLFFFTADPISGSRIVCDYSLPVLPDCICSRRQTIVVWESDCLDCSSIAEIETEPQIISLNRVSISPPPSSYDPLADVTWDFWPATAGTGLCPTVPALTITIPYSMNVTLSS